MSCNEIEYDPNYKPKPADYSLNGAATRLEMAKRRVQLRLDIHRILKQARAAQLYRYQPVMGC